jgi:hypothetical protein
MMSSKYLLATLLAVASFSTQAAETDYTFDSVSKVKHRSSSIAITGVLVGDSAASTVTIPGSAFFERCDKVLNLMMSSPGAYILTVTTEIFVSNPPPYTAFVGCSLELKP